MLFIIKRIFLIIIVLGMLFGCKSKALSSAEKSEKVKSEITKKQKAEKEKKRNAGYKRHIDMQAESTRESMKRNKAQSDKWREDNYRKKSFLNRVRDFFESLKPKPKPKDGIYTKNQKKGRKQFFLKRMFKKKRK